MIHIIRRQINAVQKQLGIFPAVAILGPRQVGKTTVARDVGKHVGKPTVYLDLESPSDYARLQEPEAYLGSHQDKLVIIDEVQRAPELFPVLRSVIDAHRENGRFLLLGSASPELLARSSETLAGRVAYDELNPFSYEEIADVGSMDRLWLRGGFPQAFLAPDDETSFSIRQQFVSTYAERDLPLLGLTVSPVFIRRMLRMLAHVHGQQLNYSALSNSLGIDQKTVRRYLDFLEYSYLIRRLEPWYQNEGKRLVRAPKVYFRDSGLYHAIADVADAEALAGFSGRGASWEGFVIQQVLSCLRPGINAYYYRTQDGAELDLVLEKGIRPVVGLEIKAGNAPKITVGTANAAAALGNLPVLVVTPGAREDFRVGKHITVTSFERMWDPLAEYLA